MAKNDAAAWAARNPTLMNHVKKHEKLRLSPYKDVGGHAIGYGAHTGFDGRPVTATTPAITEAVADAMLARDLYERRARLAVLPNWEHIPGNAKQALLDVSMGKRGILSQEKSPNLWNDLTNAGPDPARLLAAVKQHYTTYRKSDDPDAQAGLEARRIDGMKTFFNEDYAYQQDAKGGETYDPREKGSRARPKAVRQAAKAGPSMVPEDIRRMTAEMRRSYEEHKDGKPRLGPRNPNAVSAEEDRAALERLRDRRGSQSDESKWLNDAAKEAMSSAAFAGAGEIIGSTGRGLRDFVVRPTYNPRTLAGTGAKVTPGVVPNYESGSLRLVRKTDGAELDHVIKTGYQESPSIGVVKADQIESIPDAGFRSGSASAGLDFPVTIHYRRNAFKPGIRGSKMDIAVAGDSFSPTTGTIARARKAGKSYQDILKDWKDRASGDSEINRWVGLDKNGRPYVKTQEQVADELLRESKEMEALGLKRAPSVADNTPMSNGGKFNETFDRLRNGQSGTYGELKPLRRINKGAIDFVEFPEEALSKLPEGFLERLKSSGIRYRTYNLTSKNGARRKIPVSEFIANPGARETHEAPTMFPQAFREDAKGGDTSPALRAAEGGGNAGGPSGEETIPEQGVGDPSSQGGPRIVINPSTFRNEKDALCVAFNEAFRVIMEATGFEPKAEPTEAQRRFFSDTAYADDEVQLRRTILARICTFDTSIS